ncbi:MAG: DUF2852 domain-containing protein [Hyphomicrobium sp.]
MSQMIATLDDYGKPAWLAAMIVGFVLFWPIGLAILAYLLWSGRMTCGWQGGRGRWQSRFADKFDRARARVEDEVKNFSGGYPSGNRAFDDYRDATLKRLEEEERQFRAFLDRLRQAKDKSEFDAFMAERRERPAEGGASAPA